MYIHELTTWPHMTFDSEAILPLLGEVRAMQGRLLGQMSSVGFELQDSVTLTNLSLELVRSSEIEGEVFSIDEVRSSIARRLGIACAGVVPSSRYVDGVVEMQLDATQRFAEPLTDERLFGWHNVLFPSGMSGLYKIEVGKYRTGEMQVVSGAMGRERVHYEAPAASRVPTEMQRFIDWVNADATTDAVLKAGIAHLWFVTIHPFDDGNGRIARALTDMLLARSEGSARRFYSTSAAIKSMQSEYYDVLERTQKGTGDISEWLLWFLRCLQRAIDKASETE